MTSVLGFVTFAVRPCPTCKVEVEQSQWAMPTEANYWRVDERHNAPCGLACVEGESLAGRRPSMHGYEHTCPTCGRT